MILFIIALMVIVPFVIQSPQVSSAFSPGARPAKGITTQSNNQNSNSNAQSSLNFPDSSNIVSSQGLEEPYVLQQVAFASNPNQVLQITGGQIAEKIITSDNKNYLYLFVNTAKSFAVNTTDVVATAQISGFSTNNIYWNVQTPPTTGSSVNFGTIGQDLDTGATSNTLSEWQWADLNYVFGGRVQHVNYGGSYDFGGPSMCNTYSGGQERHSVYVMIADSSTRAVYTITGGELIEQNLNGLMATTFITYISGTQGRLSTAADANDCPIVQNPTVTPSLRWYVRTPPTSGVSTPGNFGITGNLGVELTHATTTDALVLYQFVDRNFQTGFIPNQGCSSCVSMMYSTNPVDGATGVWPGTGVVTSTTSSSSSSTTASSTTTSHTTSSETSSTTTTSTISSSRSGSYQVDLSISQLQQNENGKYYNIQTATFTGPDGNPIQGAQVTYFENCGCSGGYFHGSTDANGQTVVKDTYPGPGSYTEWASITYQGQIYLSQKITVQVP